MLDFLVVGHIVKDVFPDASDESRHMAGGTAFYSSIALASLGARVAVVTKLAAADRALLLADLSRAGIEVSARESRRTTEFVHAFPQGRGGERVLTLAGRGDPFEQHDLGAERAAIGYAGPLTVDDMNASVIRTLRRLCGRVAIDLQGLVRHVEDGRIVLRGSSAATETLGLAHVVKADLTEAAVVTGEREPDAAARALIALGPDEVIVTMNDRGSVLCAKGDLHRMPAMQPERLVDATGCGDTYLAAYLFARLRGDAIGEAAGFAAAAAACKLQQHGPLRRSAESVRAFLGGQ